MPTGALDVNGIWQYGEDDSETTFSALLNKLGGSVSNTMKGRIVQIVQGTTSTVVSSSSSTYLDTGLTATITPKSASNKIIVLVSQAGLYRNPATSTNSLYIRLVKNGTFMYDFAYALGYGDGQLFYPASASTAYVDSPASTSALTYKTQFRNETNSAVIRVQEGGTSIITLIEVSA